MTGKNICVILNEMKCSEESRGLIEIFSPAFARAGLITPQHDTHIFLITLKMSLHYS